MSTALSSIDSSGCVEIRHPFHPLKGQRFAVLKRRRVSGVDTLIVADPERGSFGVPLEWTNWALPNVQEQLGTAPGRLDVNALCDLAALVEQLMPRRNKESL